LKEIKKRGNIPPHLVSLPGGFSGEDKSERKRVIGNFETPIPQFQNSFISKFFYPKEPIFPTPFLFQFPII
jgi:hypothetical protein